MAQHFFTEDTTFGLKHKLTLKAWIRELIYEEKKGVGELNFIFCSDEYLLNINMRHLNHHYYTDVITFDYTEDNIISGDIFISVDTVLANAEVYMATFSNELYRVMAHGVLHLCGYKDTTKKQQEMMRAAEDLYIEKLPVLAPQVLVKNRFI
jgi:rRNA maturation RNase YbeY